MWIFITFLSMLFCASTEIVGKKTAALNSEYGILKLRISVITVDTAVMLFMCLIHYGCDFTAPLRIIMTSPLIILTASLTVLDTFLYLLALKYIGLIIQEAYYGANGILFFIGLIFTNLISGKLSVVKDILIPGKLIAVLLMITATFILPGLSNTQERTDEYKKTSRRNITLGLVLSFLGLSLDAVEMVISALLFDESDISSVDCMTGGFLVAFAWGILFYVILFFKTKKLYIPIGKKNKIYAFYGLTNIFYTITYLYGISLAPIKANILWNAYPIIPIIGAFVFLKERYTKKQYACIAVILISSLLFVITEYTM